MVTTNSWTFVKDTFPLAVYGLQDVFSGRILFLKLWTSNSDPRLIGKWYLQHIYNSQGIIETSYIFIIIPGVKKSISV